MKIWDGFDQLVSLQMLVATAEHFLRQPALVAVALLLCALLTGGLGRALGVPSLIYHPSVPPRLFNGLAFGALFGWICFVAHTDRWLDWAAQGNPSKTQSKWSQVLQTAERFAGEASPWTAFHSAMYFVYTVQAVFISFVIVLVLGLMVQVGVLVAETNTADGPKVGWWSALVRRVFGVPRDRSQGVTGADVGAWAAGWALFAWKRATFWIALSAGLLAVTYLVGSAAIDLQLYKAEANPDRQGGRPDVTIAEWTRGDVITASLYLLGAFAAGHVITFFWPRFTGARPNCLMQGVRLVFTPVVVACFTAAAAVAAIELFVYVLVRKLVIERWLRGAGGDADFGPWLGYLAGPESCYLLLAVLASAAAGSGRLRRRLEKLISLDVVAGFTAAAVVVATGLFVDGLARTLREAPVPRASGEGGSYGPWLDYPTGLESFCLLLLVLLGSLAAGSRWSRCRLERLVPPAPTPAPGTPPAATVPTTPPAASAGTPAPPAPAAPPFEWPYTEPPALNTPRECPTLHDLDLPPDQPLVVLAVSGGGLVAAGWTVLVLTELEQRVRAPGQRLPVRFASGASGGMLGAAYHAVTRALHPPTGGSGPTAQQMFNRITADFLSPVIRWWAFHDLPRTVSPFHLMGFDRGRVLERAWVEELGREIAGPLAGLRDAERRGACPALVFSPMLVEDGRRLLISNLNFGWLNDVQPDSYRELFKLFPDAHPLFPVATGARLSATFPLVSPAAVLPTRPRRRVVDAGYFDNYGVHLATAWVRELARTGKLPRRVAFVEVRAFQRGGNGERSAGWAARAWEDLTTPVEGLLSARQAVTAYRNDELIELLRRDVRATCQFERFVFECPTELPLNWFLTEADRAAMTTAFGRNLASWQVDATQPLTRVQTEADEFRNWLATGARQLAPAG